MPNELKPCPYCGGPAEMKESMVVIPGCPPYYDGSCLDMRCRGYATVVMSESAEEAEEKWNRRATP